MSIESGVRKGIVEAVNQERHCFCVRVEHAHDLYFFARVAARDLPQVGDSVEDVTPVGAYEHVLVNLSNGRRTLKVSSSIDGLTRWMAHRLVEAKDASDSP